MLEVGGGLIKIDIPTIIYWIYERLKKWRKK